LKKRLRNTIGGVVDLVAGYYNLDVDIFIETEALEENSAELEILGGGVYSIILDRKFVKNEDLVYIIRAVAHEMVHVKQHELDDLCLETEMFKGEQWGGDYWFAPWEVEARGLEEAFLMHYLFSQTANSENFLTKK
jgi:hypothetical protein